MVVKLWSFCSPSSAALCNNPCKSESFGGTVFPPVSVYNGLYHASGLEIEAPNLIKKKQTEQPLLTQNIQPQATHSPAGFSVLEICQQRAGTNLPVL